MYWLITTRFGGAFVHPITGKTLGCEKILSRGYSSEKLLEALRIKSWLGFSPRLKNLAAISLPCQTPFQVSPECVEAIFSFKWSSFKLIPECLESVASLDRALVPSQLWF